MEREHLPGTIKLWPGVAEELLGTKAYFVRAGVVQGRRRRALRARRLEPERRLGRRRRQRPGLGRVHLQGRERARGRRAVARPVGARRRRADGHRLELPPRAPAPPAALALRDHQRRRPAERRAAERVASGTTSARPTTTHIKEMWEIGDTMAQGGGDDDRHRGHDRACSARRGRGTSTRPSPRRCTRTSRRSACRQWSEADQTLAKALQRELKVPEVGLATKLSRCAAARRFPTRRSAAAARTTSATSRGTCRRSRSTIPSNIQAGPGHNWANAISMATPIAHKGVDRRREGAWR